MFVVIGYYFLGKFFESNFDGCRNMLKINTFTKTNKPTKNFYKSGSILKNP